MENVGSSFFHMAVGAVLFVAAVVCLMFGVRSVTMSVKMRQNDLMDETLYETSVAEDERVVMGDWVMSFVMSAPEYDIRIELRDGTVYAMTAGSYPAGIVETISIPLTATFVVSYEYGAYGGLKAVVFKER